MQRHLEADFFSADELALAKALADAGQRHLFDAWAPPGTDDESKRTLLGELARADAAYPGGLGAYVANARRLLASARAGANPYEGFAPERPETIDLQALDDQLRHFERLGLAHAGGLAVVLVAGGLGERLGFPGIKVDIRVDLTSGLSYLELYGAWIRAVGRRTGRRPALVIMTSGDTHERTLASLERHRWLGLGRDGVTVLRQELVPALSDNDARLATSGPYALQLKPHGHGDVHMLLHQSGTARRLAEQGVTHLAFIQDTNAQIVHSLLPTLGVSVARELAFNTVAVPRVAGEAVGAVTRLVSADRILTVNVEYNQLDGLLRVAGYDGDAGDALGLSPYPGNTNTLMITMGPYLEVLEASGGIIAEFVNPKYADDARTTFKKPTRLETMMQDLPKLFAQNERVGVTVFDRRMVFSADKNALADAQKKAAAGKPPECGASAEDDWYEGWRRKLAVAGAQLEEGVPETWLEIPTDGGARVSLGPDFALTTDELVERVGRLRLGNRTHLRVDGDVTLQDVELSGEAALVIEAAPGASVLVRGLVLDAPGLRFCALEGEAEPDLAIRGYRLEEVQPLTVRVDEGAWELGAGGELRRLA